LSWQAWLLSIAFGAGELVWNVVIAYIFPEEWVPQAIINIFKINLSDEEEADSEKDDPEGRGIINKVSEKSLNASALPMPYADEDKVAGAGSTEPSRGWSILRSSRVRAQLRSVSAFTTLSRNIKTANTNRALQERVNRLAQSNILGMADVVAQTQMQKRTPAQQLWHQAAKTINRKGSEETLEPISNRTDLNDEDAVDTRSPSYSKAFVQNSQL